MIVKYIDAALRRAKYEMFEDGTFVGTVPGLRGVLANAPSLEQCRDELSEVVEGWVLVRIAHGLRVPSIGGVKIAVRTVA